jgi:ABC-type transport system involved in cytochrome c biogenesis permease subunit
MKRGGNGAVWLGFVLALAAAPTYPLLFARFPVTRDFPWANLLLFLIGGCFLAIGMRRAYSLPERYRGKISSVVLSVLSLAVFGLFMKGILVDARNIPSGAEAVRAGQPAPEFQLTDANGQSVALSALRQGKRGVLLIFYRGYW